MIHLEAAEKRELKKVRIEIHLCMPARTRSFGQNQKAPAILTSDNNPCIQIQRFSPFLFKLCKVC